MSAARRPRPGDAARITVPEMFEAMGYEPVKRHTWAAGSAVARIWRTVTGTEPLIVYQPKTSGASGRHHIATYPETWRERICAVVVTVAEAKRTPRAKPSKKPRVQPSLFDGLAA